MKPGDKVVAVKDIGGVLRPHVPAGSVGHVTKAGWGEIKVLFTVKGMFSDSQHEITVTKDEIGG